MATPLTADQLLAALKTEGCTVSEVRSWRTHNRNSRGAWGPVNGIIVHHTATGPGVNVVDLIYNGDADLPGPLATGCITKDGVVHLVANGRANHAGGGDPNVLAAVLDESYGDRPPAPHQHQGSVGAVDGNRHFYGWECENRGDGADPWPRVQYVAIVKSTAAVIRAHRAKGDEWGLEGKSAIGHLEWSDWKPDPRGFDMKDFRQDLADCLALPPGQWASTQGGDDPMPLYVNLGIDEPFELAPGADWDAIEFTAEWADEPGGHATDGSVFVRGPARFTGELNLAVTGLPAGRELQVRQSECDVAGAYVRDHPVGEITGTGGTSFAKVPVTGCVDSGRHMRIRVKAFEATAVRITSAVLKVLVWKES